MHFCMYIQKKGEGEQGEESREGVVNGGIFLYLS